MDRTYEVEIDPETEITVCSGEIGCDGHCEIYRRKRTVKALKRRIKKNKTTVTDGVKFGLRMRILDQLTKQEIF